MPADGTTAKVEGGAVLGAVLADGVVSFRGIPFAEPPVGHRRFRAPQRVAGWDGTRDATRFGAAVPQLPPRGPIGELFIVDEPQGADCLNLNVWTPDVGAAGLPVLVWFHGGAFTIGSGSDRLYDGAAFARDGVVTVTSNYRLGAAGFAHVGDDVRGSGAFGLLDQLAALEWVQANIQAFGGDPGRVTVAGESAGAMSIGALLASPASNGLFGRAILQSGAAHHSRSAAQSTAIGELLFTTLGVTHGDPTTWEDLTDDALLDGQRAVVDLLVGERRADQIGDALVSAWPWLPMHGGDVLAERPIDAIVAGAGKEVDLLVGTCRDEMMLFFGSAPEADFAWLDESTVATAFGGVTPLVDARDALEAYRQDLPGASPLELLAALETDRTFTAPAWRLLEAHATNGGCVHAYRFSWGSRAFDGRLGAAHAVDIPFVFDSLGSAASRRLTGEGAPQELADEMHGAWVAFIRDGDPGWAPYDSARRVTRDFGGSSLLVEDPASLRRGLWARVA